jgi:argininosuccinate lyase
MTNAAPTALWGGRFEGALAPELEDLNRSLPVDRRIWREDVAVSSAWARALEGAGVLTPQESAALVSGLGRVAERLAEWSEAEWTGARDEDIHTLVERLLYAEVGPVAGKLATGRSRNDQVSTGTRLWAMDAARRLDIQVADLQRALVGQAEDHLDTLFPAYTHLQRAQPVLAAHWLLRHVWPLFRDRERLVDALGRVAVMPLGAGAVAGCAYPVDRGQLARTLGFEGVSANSMDAVSDRDFVAELLFVLSMVGSHLSALAEDVIIFSTSEFGFVALSDRYSTGSSLMPQKRNPDSMELARGKAGCLIGELVGWLVTSKGLPSGYNKDLQEDKRALFQAFDVLTALLPAVTGTIREMRLDVAACAAGLDSAMLTTDLADALVDGGLPFREAHELVGRLVKMSERTGRPIEALSPDQVLAVSHAFSDVDLDAAMDPRRSVERRAVPGGTAAAAVRDQLRAAVERLGSTP